MNQTRAKEDPEQICEKLQNYFTKYYWEMINTAFKCLKQVIFHDFVIQSSVMNLISEKFLYLNWPFEKAYKYYWKQKYDNTYLDYSDSERKYVMFFISYVSYYIMYNLIKDPGKFIFW